MDYESWCSLSEEDLAQRDVGFVNLAEAFGLPGAENLDVEACRQRLDEWAEVVRERTGKWWRQFLANPGAFDDSPGQFRMLALVTVLQRELGATYRPQMIDGTYDCAVCRIWFVHGPLWGSGGTCTSLPVLYMAVGRRLGYPLKLAEAREHYFVRWDDPAGERFNVKGSGRGFSSHSDDYYLNWPGQITDRERRACHMLRSFTPREELAAFLKLRGSVWRDNLRLDLAGEAFHFARQLDPAHAGHRGAQAVNTVMQRIDDNLRRAGFPLDEPLQVGLERATPPPVETWEKWATPLALEQFRRIASVRRQKQASTMHADLFVQMACDSFSPF